MTTVIALTQNLSPRAKGLVLDGVAAALVCLPAVIAVVLRFA